MRKLLLMIVPLILISCAESKPQEAEAPSPKELDNMAVVNKSVQKQEESTALTSYSGLQQNLDKKVTVIAKKSEFIMQHMMAYSPSLPEVTYIDLDGGAQIAVYSLKPIPCKGKVKITGTVGKVSGAGKGGGTHSELYLYVDEWECMD